MAFLQGPGFRFNPTDEEMICFYLKKKLIGNLPSCFDYLAVIDIYKFEPWDLPSLSRLKTKDLEWYFFTVLDKKYGHGIRTNRATERGYWKTTGKDRVIRNGGVDVVGMKKTLVYHLGRAPHGDRTNWVMHEYRMINEALAKAGVQDTYVLCRIFQKSGSGPKNGEKYGAPFVEEEWENTIPLVPVKQVSAPTLAFALPLTPACDVDEEANPLVAVDNEQVDPMVDFNSEPLEEKVYALTDDYLEARDLDKELENSVTDGSADLQSNFSYGEYSSHPQQSQAFNNDPKQLEATLGIYDNQIDQSDIMDDLFGAVVNSVQDEYNGETNLNEDALNFNFASEDPDQYFDAPGYLATLDEDISQINDFENFDGHIPTDIDPSIAAMLDEYLACPDEDISKFICFDSPLNVGSESHITNCGHHLIEQNVEKVSESCGSFLANKHVYEAQPGNKVLAKEDLEAENWVSGDTNAFVQQANKMLASIPAPPSLASEFPPAFASKFSTKEFDLGRHLAESSNSGHITADMISLTDITFRGNAMDWMVGKNGGFNTIISTGFPQTDINSATLVPISGLVCSKAEFILSHGWVFLMGFSVVILSMSFKIGSFMYTGK